MDRKNVFAPNLFSITIPMYFEAVKKTIKFSNRLIAMLHLVNLWLNNKAPIFFDFIGRVLRSPRSEDELIEYLIGRFFFFLISPL